MRHARLIGSLRLKLPFIHGSGHQSPGHGYMWTLQVHFRERPCLSWWMHTPNASIVASTSSKQAIKALRRVFATHGLPEVLVSDNGTAFTSTEFQTFVKRNGFRHVKTAPYHPASNGLAERAVQTVKEALKKSSGDMEACFILFLFQYRLTPHSTTGRSPAELLLGRQPRSHLDFRVPERQDKECNNTDLESHVRKNQECQKTGHHQYA